MTKVQSIIKAAMRYCIMSVAILAFHLSILATAKAFPADEARYFYDVIVSGPADEELSSGVLFIRYIYNTAISRSGHGMDATEKQIVFNELLRLGIMGDIHALAMASVLPHVDPEFSEGIDVSPIEPWLIRHLGEAEGHWLLGVFYLHWLSGSPPLSYASVYENAPKHFRKSALAGNRKSMLFTSDYAPKGDDFTPPQVRNWSTPWRTILPKGIGRIGIGRCAPRSWVMLGQMLLSEANMHMYSPAGQWRRPAAWFCTIGTALRGLVTLMQPLG
jgi:hypothetical protein